MLKLQQGGYFLTATAATEVVLYTILTCTILIITKFELKTENLSSLKELFDIWRNTSICFLGRRLDEKIIWYLLSFPFAGCGDGLLTNARGCIFL